MQINWTLSDFYVDFPINCGSVKLSQQVFNCSRAEAEKLQLQLQFWTLHRDLMDDVVEITCPSGSGCTKIGRSEWVNQLNLNTSDPVEGNIDRYLRCII